MAKPNGTKKVTVQKKPKDVIPTSEDLAATFKPTPTETINLVEDPDTSDIIATDKTNPELPKEIVADVLKVTEEEVNGGESTPYTYNPEQVVLTWTDSEGNVLGSTETPPEAPTIDSEQLSTESDINVADEEGNVSEENTDPSEDILENINITHTIPLSGAKIDKVIDDVIYLASLGAVATPKFLPRILGMPPYIIKMDIDNEGYNSWLNRFDEPSYNTELQYDEIGISTPDPKVFIDRIVESAKDGNVRVPHKGVRLGMPFKVALATRKPLKSNSDFTVQASGIVYTTEELHSMKFQELKILGDRYGIKVGNRSQLIRLILQAQK